MQPRQAAALSRRSFLLTGTAVAATPFLLGGRSALGETLASGDVLTGASARDFGFPPADLTSKIVRDITFPVEGPVSWIDSYGDCRDGCARHHEGQDLMGTKLQKLLAVRDAEVVALDYDSSGNALYLRDDDGWYYAYLHINNDSPGTDDGKNPRQWAFAPGIAVGKRVTRGQHVAYLGDSGNAESAGAHCHFEIRKPTSAGVWKSQAVNPKPSLDAAKAAVRVASTTFSPWDNADDLIVQQYRDFLGRAPDSAGLAYYRGQLNSGTHPPDWLIEVLLHSDGCQDQAGALVRLYRAYFQRDADFAGFDYWVSRLRLGYSILGVSQFFAASSEFETTYGALTDGQFVETIYANVLGRAPDDEGRAFWEARLADGTYNRGRLMLLFSESAENKAAQRADTDVTLVHALMLRQMPDTATLTTWRDGITGGDFQIRQLIMWFRASAPYAARFGS